MRAPRPSTQAGPYWDRARGRARSQSLTVHRGRSDGGDRAQAVPRRPAQAAEARPRPDPDQDGRGPRRLAELSEPPGAQPAAGDGGRAAAAGPGLRPGPAQLHRRARLRRGGRPSGGVRRPPVPRPGDPAPRAGRPGRERARRGGSPGAALSRLCGRAPARGPGRGVRGRRSPAGGARRHPGRLGARLHPGAEELVSRPRRARRGAGGRARPVRLGFRGGRRRAAEGPPQRPGPGLPGAGDGRLPAPLRHPPPPASAVGDAGGGRAEPSRSPTSSPRWSTARRSRPRSRPPRRRTCRRGGCSRCR